MPEGLGIAAATAFGVTVLLLWVLGPIATRINLVDHPGGRKHHAQPTPLIGGIAIVTGFSLAALASGLPLSPFRALFGGALILVIVGVLDDLRELSPRSRLLAQLGASFLMAVGAGVVLTDLGYLLGPDWLMVLGFLATPFTLFAATGLMNAINMSDGVDGLSASLVLIALLSLVLVASTSGQSDKASLLVPLLAALLAFLLFNLRPQGHALVFMGDAGSLVLGFALCWFLISFSQGSDRLMAPVTALWLIALPLIDTLVIMGRRIAKGQSPLRADRQHYHHILLAAGFSPKQALGIMLLLALATTGIGLAGHFLGTPEHIMFWGFMALLGLHAWMIIRAWQLKRFLGRALAHQAAKAVSCPRNPQARTGHVPLSWYRHPQAGPRSGKI